MALHQDGKREGRRMAIYRVYLIGAEGCACRFQEFDALTDQAAVPLAAMIDWQGPVELWTESRRVQQWGSGCPASRQMRSS